jgi:hypothetical protein
MSLSVRIAIAAALLVLEKLILNSVVDFQHAQAARGLGAVVRVTQHWGLRFLVTLAIALAFFIYLRGRPQLAQVDAAARAEPLRPRWLLLHGALLPPLAALSYLLYGPRDFHLPFVLVVCLWLLLALISLVALFAGMAPSALWKRAARAVGALWVYAFAAAARAAAAIQWRQGMCTIT